MTVPPRPKDESPEHATHILDYAASILRAFAGKTPFIDPGTGRTLQPHMPFFLYKEIARVHAELGELLKGAPATGDDGSSHRVIAQVRRKTMRAHDEIDADTHVKCALCKRKSPPEIMKKFTGGYVHFLCDTHEKALWGMVEETRSGDADK